MLESLTTAHERTMGSIANRYIRELTDPPRYSKKAILAWLEVAYRLYDLEIPNRIEIVNSPHRALALASELTGAQESSLDWTGVSDGGWLAFYEFFRSIDVLTAEDVADVLALRDFGRSAWDSVLLDECAIVIRRPKQLHVDDDGNLHRTTGPAIEWRDGERDYAYHGTWIPERMVTAPRSYTKAEYLAITNTEERRALSEIAGWDWVVSLLGGTTINEWIDPITRLRYELIACEDGQKLLRKESPQLANRSQPSYIEPVHEDLKTAQAARKWQATTLGVPECEADPGLDYGVES